MNSRTATQVTFHPIRGGRFSATLPPRVARQLADAVMNMEGVEETPRFERQSLQARLSSGQPMSQGDIFSLLRFRPHLQNLSPDALSALEQTERYVRERTESIEKRFGLPRNPFHPILVLPPKPSTTESERSTHDPAA